MRKMSGRESSTASRRGGNHVSRKKYDALKNKAQDWYDRANDLHDKYDKLLSLNEELERENEKLSGSVRDLTSTVDKANEDIKRWKTHSENLPDADLLEELEQENKGHRKTIRNLKKDVKDLEEKYLGKVATLERDIMLKDGKIQQLEEARKDIKERYKELKEDYREQQRWVRGNGSVANRE